MTVSTRTRVIRFSAVAGFVAAAAVSVSSVGAQFDASRAPLSVIQKKDSMKVTLAALQRIEVKLVMKKGEKAQYNWRTDGAEVTYNLHAEGPDAPGGKAHTYQRGSSKAEQGEIVAVFDGVHGWSWRNTTEKPVTVTVTATGQFSELKKM